MHGARREPGVGSRRLLDHVSPARVPDSRSVAFRAEPQPGARTTRTFSDVLRGLEEQLFVGRERELAFFRRWLDAGANSPEILNVSGPGGVGKSTLLRAFGRLAESTGRRVVCLDGHHFRAGSDGLLAALGREIAIASAASSEQRPDIHAVLIGINHLKPLLLLDAFEEIADLTSYLRDELLPRLDAAVRVVIAGRYPLGLAWRRADTWQHLIHPLPLDSFAPAEARAFLARRGVSRPEVVGRILRAAGGHPLALALAADLALEYGVGDFRRSPEWRLAVRRLVERLLSDLADPDLRELLEASTVLRHIDEAALAVLAGPAAKRAFDRLWHLSVVQAAEHGLMLHDDVRRILVEDLRWRDPERYRELRSRAAAHYRARMVAATAEERERLLADRLFLWEDAFVRDLLFPDAEPGQVWLEAGHPEDLPDLLRIWALWLEQVLSVTLRPTFDREQDRRFLCALLRYSGTRLRIARDRDGQPLGFNSLVPVCRESLAILEGHPGIVPAVHAYEGTADPMQLPATAEDATVFYLLHVAHTDVLPEAVQAALARDLVGMLAHGGTYLASTPLPAYQRLLELMGWQRLPAARNFYWSDDVATEAYVLDLNRTGVETWIDAVMGLQPHPESEGATGGTSARRRPAPTTRHGSRPSTTGKLSVPLTARERELAVFVARGRQNRDIATDLRISVRTVEAHIEHIRRKLGVHSRAEIAAWAAQWGLIEGDHEIP